VKFGGFFFGSGVFVIMVLAQNTKGKIYGGEISGVSAHEMLSFSIPGCGYPRIRNMTLMTVHALFSQNRTSLSLSEVMMAKPIRLFAGVSEVRDWAAIGVTSNDVDFEPLKRGTLGIARYHSFCTRG